MVNKDNVFEVCREGYRLLKLEGNCGRTLRRFLQHHSYDGCINQVFNDYTEKGASAQDLAALGLYADVVKERNAGYLNGALAYQETLKGDFNIVSNTYKFSIDLDTASVAELKAVVHDVVVLSENLQAFALTRDQILEDYAEEAKALLASQADVSSNLLPLFDRVGLAAAA